VSTITGFRFGLVATILMCYTSHAQVQVCNRTPLRITYIGVNILDDRGLGLKASFRVTPANLSCVLDHSHCRV
jgi:hypothetical protein